MMTCRNNIFFYAIVLFLNCFNNIVFAEEIYAAEATPPAHVISYNLGLYSMYVYRGMTQTGNKPALQGGADYSHESGVYLGVWGSNITWLKDNGAYTDSLVEIDYYGGYTNSIGESDFDYNLGIAHFNYPGKEQAGSGFVTPNTTEITGTLIYKWLAGVLHYTVSQHDSQIPNARGSGYSELNADIPILETGFTANLHAGYQYYAGSSTCPSGGTSNRACYNYADGKVGLTKSFGNGVIAGGYYTFTNAKPINYLIDNENIGRNLFVMFVQKTWGD